MADADRRNWKSSNHVRPASTNGTAAARQDGATLPMTTGAAATTTSATVTGPSRSL